MLAADECRLQKRNYHEAAAAGAADTTRTLATTFAYRTESAKLPETCSDITATSFFTVVRGEWPANFMLQSLRLS